MDRYTVNESTLASANPQHTYVLDKDKR